MRILVTNDDGIYSPGIAALAEVASEYGEVRIVAPDVEQSSMGHAITSRRPLSYTRTPIGDFEAYRVNGTPADCVALGIHQWEDVDIVLSGINLGLNIGNGIWHSGTLAAAKQAPLLKVRGVALSTVAGDSGPNFDHLRPYVRKVIRYLIDYDGAPLVNVNFPPEPRGMCWARQSVRHYDGKIVTSTDPMGREHFWFTVAAVEQVEKGTDRWAIENGYVSMTPLTLDLTDEKVLERAVEEMPVS